MSHKSNYDFLIQLESESFLLQRQKFLVSELKHSGPYHVFFISEKSKSWDRSFHSFMRTEGMFNLLYLQSKRLQGAL